MYIRQSTMMVFLSLIISGTIFLQMGIYVVSLLAGWNVRFNLVAVCHSWLKMIGLSSLEFILDALVIYTLSFSVWKILSQWVQASRMKKRFELYKAEMLTINMNQSFSQGKDDFIVISHPAPLAITMGFIQPKIVLSTGLISLLNEEELQAVIAHELYHKENRDPLTMFLMALCASTIWYIPILQWFNEQYRIIKELLADDYAIDKQRTSVNLSSALLKMLKVGQHEKMAFAYASFADTSINYRIDYLLDPVKGFQMKWPLHMTLLSFTIFCLICSLFIYVL
jgi:beta-lactamase regulating signal transducer with metallopeptidase domain